MLKSHSLVWSDFQTDWYKRWAKELYQDTKHLENYALHANKFWQNAAMVQALWERQAIQEGAKGLGFGVGQERLPALFAKYGVHITATDQDFTTQKAGHWAEHELATSAQSLNRLKICDPKKFKNQVEYMPVDMKKVPKKLHGKYDFLWSNCALGHLGSIPDGLNFIESSLQCLKPGGWAVHTTELNILSNGETVTGGSTVIFRLKDIQSLSQKLTKQGYIVSPLALVFGPDEKDKRISMRPEFGNDFSKIQVMGHLATQILLIIHKPKNFQQNQAPHAIFRRQMSLRRSYLRNLQAISRYKRSDRTVVPILKSQKTKPTQLDLTPAKTFLKVKIKKGESTSIYLDFKNNSKVPLFDTYARLGENKPITLATTKPNDRASQFFDKSWHGKNKNRPSVDVYSKAGRKYTLIDYVQPGQEFAFLLTLNSNKLQKGTYTEEFSIVQEHAGWVPNTSVTVHVEVV